MERARAPTILTACIALTAHRCSRVGVNILNQLAWEVSSMPEEKTATEQGRRLRHQEVVHIAMQSQTSHSHGIMDTEVISHCLESQENGVTVFCLNADLRQENSSTTHGDAFSTTDMGKQTDGILMMSDLASPASEQMEELITSIVMHWDCCYHLVPTGGTEITMRETFRRYPLWPRSIVLLNTSGRTFTTIIDAMFNHVDLENYVTISVSSA